MSETTEALREPLHKAVDEMEAGLLKLREERESLREREINLHSELRAVQAALAKVDPSYEHPQRPKKKSKPKNGNGISVEILDRIMEKARDEEKKHGHFTQRGVRVSAKLSPAQASRGFTLLRDLGVIRKGGKVEGSSAEKWAIMDEGAFERYKKERANA